MSQIEKNIMALREELNKLLELGYKFTNPIVVKKSQELDRYVTAYYLSKRAQ